MSTRHGPRRAFVEWYEHLIEVRDHAELDAALDLAAADILDGVSSMAHLFWDGGATLSVGAAADYAILSFSAADGEPPYFASVSDRQAHGIVQFDVQSVLSGFPRWQCIDPALARAAMHHFFDTGERFSEAEWMSDDDWPTMPWD